MAKGLKLAALVLLTVPGLSLADCFKANQDNGELAFIGVAEGSRFTGEFGEFTVTLCMDEQDLTTAGIEVVVKTASADTGNDDRDSELLGENFFDVEEYPEASWESGNIRADGDAFVADGKLTLRGLTSDQPVRLKLSDDKSPVLSGSAEIMRLDWDVGVGEDFEDTDFIRNRVDLEFELQLQPYSKGSVGVTSPTDEISKFPKRLSRVFGPDRDPRRSGPRPRRTRYPNPPHGSHACSGLD